MQEGEGGEEGNAQCCPCPNEVEDEKPEMCEQSTNGPGIWRGDNQLIKRVCYI